MKTPIAVALIISGALLVLAPAVSDLLYQRNVVTLLTRSDVTGVTLSGLMSDLYRFGCWLTGTGMVAVAVLCALGSRRRLAESPSWARQPAPHTE